MAGYSTAFYFQAAGLNQASSNLRFSRIFQFIALVFLKIGLCRCSIMVCSKENNRNHRVLVSHSTVG